jgi:exosortase A-associated hydrolase 1
MTAQQRVLRFSCRDCWLIGVLHLPEQPLSRGVLIVTGGPQYRIGSHRQFVLLAQHLAQAGIPVMRFDYRGMGDSQGDARDFEQVEDDIAAAAGQFFQAVPELKELVLWGLCDGATAAAFYAPRDRRVRGLILLNPWVRTEQGQASATLRHYYVARLRDADFWRKLASGAVEFRRSLRSLAQLLAAARRPDPAAGQGQPSQRPQHGLQHGLPRGLPQRLHAALSSFRGRILIVLSGADLGAREFSALQERQEQWRSLLAAPRVRQTVLPQANHTFAREAWREQVAVLCADWIAAW